MLTQLKSEFKKLLTVRSTYYFLLFCLAVDILFAFYVEGFRVTQFVSDPGKLAGEARSAFQSLATLLSLVGILLVTHEYRYNTIMYTLTAARSRAQVFFAKFIVVTVFALAASLLFAALAPLFTMAGLQLQGTDIAAQSIPYVDLLWHGLLFVWGYAILAFIFAFVIRSQVGAIMAFVLLPGIGEMLLTLLLKDNAKYLPFTALNRLWQNVDTQTTVLTVLAYVVGGSIVALLLFQKRDAN